MWLDMRINFTLGLLQTKHITIGDLWKVSHIVIRDSCFERVCYVPLSPQSSRVLQTLPTLFRSIVSH